MRIPNPVYRLFFRALRYFNRVSPRVCWHTELLPFSGRMNSEKETPIKTDQRSCERKRMTCRGKCIWLKEEGSPVYKSEEIGYVVVDNGFRSPVRSPIEGTIKRLVVRVGVEH